MAKFRISGVWKDANDAITHFAFHTVNGNGMTQASKTAKDDAIALLETRDNSASTVVWNYRHARWEEGEPVRVVDAPYGKYLRSIRDSQLGDNLDNLIDYGQIVPFIT